MIYQIAWLLLLTSVLANNSNKPDSQVNSFNQNSYVNDTEYLKATFKDIQDENQCELDSNEDQNDETDLPNYMGKPHNITVVITGKEILIFEFEYMCS